MKSFRRWNGDHWFWRMAIGLCVLLYVVGLTDAGATVRWICANDQAWEMGRFEHASVVFRDRLWILGGQVTFCDEESLPTSYTFNEVWGSADGTHWSYYGNAPWPARTGHTALAFKDKMWVMGGGTGGMNDVWYAGEDGQWVQATEHAAWLPREQHTAVVFDNKMWVLGGDSIFSSSYLSDVWSSEDGITWTEVTRDAPWGPRYKHTSVVFNGKIWVMGGYTDDQQNDVWSSVNGKDWVEVTSSALWGPRTEHVSVVYQNRLWVMGGTGSTFGVWQSLDGAVWGPVNSGAPPRYYYTAAEFRGTLWMAGGFKSGCQAYGNGWNDVWYMTQGVSSAFSADVVRGAAPMKVQFSDQSTGISMTITDWTWDFGDGTGSNEQNPSHIYAQRGLYTVSLTVASDTDTDTNEEYVLVAGEQHPFHSADADKNSRISLSELLRVIQFYNYGSFHCAVGTEDGYAPGPGGMGCGLYDGDYAPPDGQMNLSEVLRVIQFFNMRGYHACVDGEDGFCPGIP